MAKDSELAIIKEQTSFTLGALVAKDLVAGSGPVLAAGFRIVKTVWVATITGLTSNEGVGLVLGIANGDLSASLIEASLEAGGPKFRGDRDFEELANRFTKMLGMTQATLVSGVETAIIGPEGGSPSESILRWSFPLGTTGWKWFLYNLGGTLTTGASLNLLATHYGVWLK